MDRQVPVMLTDRQSKQNKKSRLKEKTKNSKTSKARHAIKKANTDLRGICKIYVQSKGCRQPQAVGWNTAGQEPSGEQGSAMQEEFMYMAYGSKRE